MMTLKLKRSPNQAGTDFMNEPTSNQTLDIAGTINSYTRVAWRLGWAVACVGLGIFLWLQMKSSWRALNEYDFSMYIFLPVIAFITAAILPYNGHTYLDFSNRHIVTFKHYCGFAISKRSRPLTDFSHIVVRHLCHPGGEGPDTYTGSVGLKPVDGRAVLWVKSFPTTQDEVPRTTHEFARKLQEMTGLPVAATGESKSETR